MRKLVLGTLAVVVVLSLAAPAQDTTTRNRDAVVAKLTTMVIDISFEDESLTSIVEFMQEYTGLTWLIDPRVEDPDGMEISLQLRGVKVLTAMKIFLREHELAAMYRDGMVVIVNKEDVQYSVVIEIYDVRDLFVRKTNFPGPRLELLPGRDAGGGPGVSFTLEEPEEPKLDEGLLEDIIRSTTGGESWDENDRADIRMSPNGLLIIAQSRDVHKQIRALIQKLRWFR